MFIRKNKQKIILTTIEAILIILTLLSFLKGIWISLDIDESYAVAIGYRMVKGDRLIRDMWEPHQFSGFLTALFIAPYIWIRGNTDYLVVYLRIVGILIHTGLGLVMYQILRKKTYHFFAFCITLLHLNFLPKWIQMPEFELMHYWCLLGIFLVLYAYFMSEKPKILFLFLGGCLLLGSMLCYPTMILLYPFYILAICTLERQYFKSSGKNLWKSSFFFTLGAVLSGCIVLVYLFSYMSFSELKRYISYIFLDTSHGVYTMEEKWTNYLEQVQEQMQTEPYSRYVLVAVGIILAICVIHWSITSKMISSEDKLGRTMKFFSATDILPAVSAALVLAGLLMQGRAIFGFLFEDENQFFLQLRYMVFLVPAILLGIRYYRTMALWLYLCVIPGIVSVVAVLFVTNMGINVAYAKAYFGGVIGSFLLLDQYSREIIKSSFWKSFFMFFQYTAGVTLLTGLLVCRLILIRVSGCLPVTILASLEKMESGPEKGIWILADTAEIWNDNYRELEKYVTGEEKILYIGAESLIYLKMDAQLATPSTQGTTVYNEMFLYYYEEHPDRVPNVIVYDKTFGENQAYAISYTLSLQNPIFFQWIEENYGDGEKNETEHMIILKRNGTAQKP